MRRWFRRLAAFLLDGGPPHRHRGQLGQSPRPTVDVLARFHDAVVDDQRRARRRLYRF